MPSLSSSSSHNAISVLRYNSFSSQAPLSQYTAVYYDTNLNHPATQSQYTSVYCNTISHQPQLPMLQYNTLLQYHFSAFQPTIQFCIATQPRLFLQYNSNYSSPPHCNTISTHCTPQGPRSRCNCLLAIQKKKKKKFHYSLGSSPKRFLHQIFFFFIFHFHLIQLFPAAGKTTKNYIYLFFFFFIFLNTEINL